MCYERIAELLLFLIAFGDDAKRRMLHPIQAIGDRISSWRPLEKADLGRAPPLSLAYQETRGRIGEGGPYTASAE